MASRHASPPVLLDLSAKLALGTVAAVGLMVIAGGGSARPDTPYVLLVRIAAIIGLAALLLFIPTERLRPYRTGLIFIAVAGALIALQLVPLPPSVWSALPGRQIYATLSNVPEIGDVWRPISLSPDLGWNALLSLLPALFFVLAVPVLGIRPRHWLLMGLLVVVVTSGLLGLLQLAGGPDSPLRHYQVTNRTAATGFFANRNHQAVFLAMGIPLAAWWATLSGPAPRLRGARPVIAASAILFLLTAAVSTQSRSGAVLIVVSLLLTAVFLVRRLGSSWKLITGLAGAAALTLALGAAAFATWGEYRRGADAVSQDLRIRILPESVEAAKTFFPVGAGFGSFPQVFRRFESVEDLAPSYVNHTHSELTQIIIEGGILSVLLLLSFLAWYANATRRAWSRSLDRNHRGGAADAQLCTILIALPLLASITDYPIRTPLMACTVAIAAAILGAAQRDIQASKARG